MTQKVILPQQAVKIVETQPAKVVEQYQEAAKEYNSAKARETLGIGNDRISTVGDEFAGSSPFINVHLANINKDSPGRFPNSHTPATRQELESATSQDKNFLRGRYTSLGLALVTDSDTYRPNHLPAQNLASQLEAREIPLGEGKLIPLHVLTLKEDEESAYGLVFQLTEQASKDSILDLAQFPWNYIRNEGLSGAYLYIVRDWGYGRYLDFSNSNSRVVGVGEASSENLNLGYTEAQLRTAFEKANVSPVYDLVKEHLPAQQ